MAPDRVLRIVRGVELIEMKQALRSAGLPADDIEEEISTFFRLDDEAGPLGWAALERHGPDALLRSVIIAPERQGRGIGSDLVRRVTLAAGEQGLARLWLLTETASPFFAKLGFASTARSSAPPAIQQTSEFEHVCPSSAECMTLKLA